MSNSLNNQAATPQKLHIAVIGSRGFDNYSLLQEQLNQVIAQHNADDKSVVIVSGGAKGADALAERYAKEYQLETLIFKPDWKQYGRGAGPIRNRLIIQAADIVLAFWDCKSKGTQHSISEAGKALVVCSY